MIELEDITKIYRMGKVEVPALCGVTFNIEQGEMLAIVGASGSGKSTLLNVIGCLDKPTMGRYTFQGDDVSRLNDNKLAEMRSEKFGFVFQEYNLLSRATALSNVELPLIYSGSDDEHWNTSSITGSHEGSSFRCRDSTGRHTPNRQARRTTAASLLPSRLAISVILISLAYIFLNRLSSSMVQGRPLSTRV